MCECFTGARRRREGVVRAKTTRRQARIVEDGKVCSEAHSRRNGPGTKLGGRCTV